MKGEQSVVIAIVIAIAINSDSDYDSDSDCDFSPTASDRHVFVDLILLDANQK